MKSLKPNKGPKNSLLGKTIPLKIEKLAVGGDGLGRYEGIVVFVPFSVPGDELLIQIIEQKSNHAFGEIKQILTASSERIKPPCSYYFDCGGCNWQHVDPKSQLKYKELIVSENLKKFLRFDVPVLPIISSPLNWRYRNRIQLSFDGSQMGFRKRKSHQIIDVSDCLISEEILTQSFPLIRKSIKNSQQRVELFLTEQGVAQWENIEETGEGVGFSQVNRFQNEDLIKTVLAWIDHSPFSILELYAGSGNFTWPLAQKFPSTPLTAVELSKKLVDRAQKLSTSFPRVKFLTSDVEAFFKLSSPQKHDLVFLDPPRQGTTSFVMESLAKMRPRQILYLSCHPVSLARDLSYFFKALENYSDKLVPKYQITRVQPFEMFPQTDHVETLVELRVD